MNKFVDFVARKNKNKKLNKQQIKIQNKTKTVKEKYLKFLQTGKVYIDTLPQLIHTTPPTKTHYTHFHTPHTHTQTCQKKTRSKIYYKYNIYIL